MPKGKTYEQAKAAGMMGSGTPDDPFYDAGAMAGTMIGGGGFKGGGGGGGFPTGPGLPPLHMEIGEDPYLKENIDWIRQRRDASNVEGQKQRAFGDIDSMANQASKGIEGMMARRGIGSSGIAIEGQKENTDAAARAKVRAGMDIDAQEQVRQDQLALQAANIMRAPSAYNLGQQQAQLNQWQAQAGQGNFMADFAQRQNNNQTQQYMDMLKMFGSVPGAGGFGNGATMMADWSGSGNPFGGVQNDPWMQGVFKGGGGFGGGGAAGWGG